MDKRYLQLCVHNIAHITIYVAEFNMWSKGQSLSLLTHEKLFLFYLL